MKTFYQVLTNSFISVCVINIMWFALSLWVYIQTKSVFATSLMYGTYLVAITLTGIWFGSIVDHNKKRTVMLISSIISFVTFVGGFLIYLTSPAEAFTSHTSLALWALVFLVYVGVVVGNIRNIAMPTLVTILVDEHKRDKANGLVGTINGVSFMIASIISGFLLATSGMFWIFVICITLLILGIVHLFFLQLPQDVVLASSTEHSEDSPKKKHDFLETISTIKAIPGLFGLIFFTTINNFLGGVFMPLMDPYGLSLVSVDVWGFTWGVLSLGFIFGGMYIAKKGLGNNPLKVLFGVNILLWIISMLFAIQPWFWLLCVGMFIWIFFMPFVEASEHTIIQKIVPAERQGRVFGFAQSVETAASPLTTFAIGPLTQFFFIPFMTTGKGVDLIGSWFGTGDGRGIALVFIVAGFLGLLLTLFAMNSNTYRLLSKTYNS